jgi:predicted transcriptional regulator
MLSIRPKWVEKIANGEKTIEVRKTRPKLEMPFKCYIYCTRDKHLAFMQNQTGTNLIACMNAETAIPVGGFLGNGKVIGEFTCDQIIDAWWDYVPDAITREVTGGNLEALDGTGMTDEELFSYVGDSMRGHCYGWHISDLRIYDAPKKLGEFWRDCLEYSELSTNCWSCENVCGDGDETDCNTDGRLYLHRPPQSWCYVEEG